MRFTPQFLDEIKARLPVSEVVGKRVRLKKAGREWKGPRAARAPGMTGRDHARFFGLAFCCM